MAFQCSYYLEPLDTTNLPRRFLDAFAAILAHSNYGPVLDTVARISARCGRCAVTCPVYQASQDPRDIPCMRSELLLTIYRRYFTLAGALKARAGNAFTLTEAYINTLAEEVYRCTACRRCKLECPLGIDHGMITHLARWILAEVGIVPKALRVATREQLDGKTHNTSAIPAAAMQDTCEFLVEDCRDTYGMNISFPIDVEGAEYVFFPAVSDYLLEPDTLMGNAAVLTATGASWTIGSHYFDGINYGLFYSDRMLDRIVSKEAEEVRRLKAQKVLIGECGHASRSAKFFIKTFCGGRAAPEVVNIMEYTWHALRSGKLELRPNAIDARVTYHDPCNIARSGWIIDQPREILRAICADYVDMTPRGKENYCCGGGGGTVSIDEIREFRTKIGGATKAEQIRRTGATILVAPCANCKKQLREVCEDHGLDHVQVVGLHDLVLKAIIPPPHMRVEKPTDPEKDK
ncbi:MAG: (Fe-S)-binding protein [Thermoanaerobaculaceae bacterium]|jgi:Fe-S oxidoreductase|nr:(Fe-S)-binding protein [Thermoanaerobaculaceae bacterium]